MARSGGPPVHSNYLWHAVRGFSRAEIIHSSTTTPEHPCCQCTLNKRISEDLFCHICYCLVFPYSWTPTFTYICNTLRVFWKTCVDTKGHALALPLPNSNLSHCCRYIRCTISSTFCRWRQRAQLLKSLSCSVACPQKLLSRFLFLPDTI